MKTQRTINEMEKPLNSILGVNIGIPSLSETGVAVMTAENVITAYEREAQEVLTRDGYPLTLEELWAKKDEVLPDLANGRGLSQIYSIFWMLLFLHRVRVEIEKSNADGAVCDMACAVHWAMRARLKPIAPFIEMSEKWTGSGEDGGKKSAEVRQAKARSLHEVRLSMAEEIWTKHPAWKSTKGKDADVARKIKKKIGGNIGTIRKSIRKPLP